MILKIAAVSGLYLLYLPLAKWQFPGYLWIWILGI